MLSRHNVEFKVLLDIDFLASFSNFVRQISFKKKIKRIVREFSPDLVLLDRQSNLGLYVKEEKIPLAVIVRGDIWQETKFALETSNSILQNVAIKRKQLIIDKCLDSADIILPISKYLTDIVKLRLPKKEVKTLYISARDPVFWNMSDKMDLQHPNVGLLQGANIWGKTKEMLILPKILEAFPNVMFYWAGDGSYKERILPILSNYNNFKWLGLLEYPNRVKEYLASIDIYALVSGMDSFGQTILEASLMKKPVIATNIGGTCEVIKNNETGFLVEEGDVKKWIEKLTILLNDEKMAGKMGEEGRKFIEKNFCWNKIVEDFIDICKSLPNKR